MADQSRIVGMQLDLEERMKHYSVPGIGIAVICEGQIEWSRGHGVMEAGTQREITADSLFHACSISKMVTAIGVLCLVKEDVLDLEKDVNQYLTSWKVPENQYTTQKKVTLGSLLAHQAGFVDPNGSFDVYQQPDPFPTPLDLLTGKTKYNPEPLQVKYEPGTRFSYSDAGYSVVEQIIEDVTGKSFVSVIEKYVLSPLGLKRTFFWNGFSENEAGWNEIKAREEAAMGHDRLGRVVAGKRAQYPNLSGAGLWTTPSDLAILTLEIIKGINGGTEAILSPDLAWLMSSGYGCEKSVGLGIFLSSANGVNSLFSQGWGVGFQCKLVAYPGLKSVIVVMTNSDPGKSQDEALVGEVLNEILKNFDDSIPVINGSNEL